MPLLTAVWFMPDLETVDRELPASVSHFALLYKDIMCLKFLLQWYLTVSGRLVHSPFPTLGSFNEIKTYLLTGHYKTLAFSLNKT